MGTIATAARSEEMPQLPLPSGSAGAVLQGHLREQLAVVLRLDPRVRAGDAEAVHRMRIATRRIRSALATFRPVLDRARTDPVRDELRWLATSLGPVRDLDVLHERLRRSLRDLPPELVVGPVVARVDSTHAAARRDALERLVAAMDQRRYVELLESLESVAARPPFAPQASAPAEELVPVLVARAFRRVRRSVDVAAESPEPQLALHRIRKDAKRARYAAEVAAPVVGAKATRAARRWKRVQSALGVVQDCAVTRVALRDLAVEAYGAGENGFTFGLLHGRDELRSRDAEDRYQELLGKALRSRPRRWSRVR